jgi:hypothetical protein
MDPVTLGMLSSTAVTLIVNFLTKAGEEAGKKAGGEIIDMLKSRFAQKPENEPAAQEALADLEQSPDNKDLHGQMRIQLEKLLKEDDELKDQLEKLLDKAKPANSNTTVINQTAGDNAKQFGQVFGDVKFGDDQ